MRLATKTADVRIAREDLASRIAEVVLFVFVIWTFDVLDPKLNVVEFSALSLRTNVAEISESNPLNQLKWVALATVAGLAFLLDPERLLRVARLGWPLILLFALCLLSTAWSGHPETTFRRSVAMIVSAFALLAAVTYIVHWHRALFVMFIALCCALAVNLAVLPLPVAFDDLGNLRAATGHKNTLGALAAIAIFVGFTVWKVVDRPILRFVIAAYMAAWLGLLVASVSKTSIALVILVPLAVSVLSGLSKLVRLNVAILLAGGLLFGLVGLGLMTFAAGFTPADAARLLTGDPTLTGRTEIWDFMLTHISQAWFLGHGFGSFWGVGFDAPNLQAAHEYIRLLNQAHNGYLDVLAHIGFVGLAVVVVTVLHFGVAAAALRPRDPTLHTFVWALLLFALIHNLAESSLLLPFNLIWHITLVALFLAYRGAAEALAEPSVDRDS